MQAESRGSRAKRPLEIRTPGAKSMMREVGRKGGVELTASAGVVDVDAKFTGY